MSAHILALVTVTDPARWSEYSQAVGATLAAHGGSLLVRGILTEAFDGTLPAQAVAVLAFPDADAARAWRHSDAYIALLPTRDAGAQITLSLF